MEEMQPSSPGEDSTQGAQESKSEGNEAPPNKYDEQYEFLVDDLFAHYQPQTALEESAVITIAVALWKKRTLDGMNAGDVQGLDLQITTALTQLLKSKAVGRSCGLTAGAADSRRNRGLANHARRVALRAPVRRCPRKALEFWTPPGEGGSPKTAEQLNEEDPFSAAILNLRKPKYT
jgi:hypothetical protein